MLGDKNRKLTSWAEERFKYCYNMRRFREKDWYAGIAFIIGKQHVAWNPVQHQLESVRIRSQYLNFVSNQIRPVYTTAMAHLSQIQPMFGTGYGGEGDQVSASVGLKLLHHYNRVLKMGQKLKIAYRWLCGTGNVFLYTYWDDRKGVAIGESVSTGDISLDVLNPFEVWFDASGNKDHLDESSFVFVGKMVKKSDLIKTFGSDAKNCAGEMSSTPTGIEAHVQQRLASLHYNQQLTDVEEKCFVKTMFVRPPIGKEEGKFIMYCDDKILSEGPFQFEDLGYPIRHIGFHPVPGCIYHDSLLKDAIAPQKAYNRKRGRIIQACDILVKPKVLVPSTARIGPRAFQGGMNEKIEYSPFGQAKPEYMPIPPIPNIVPMDLDRDRMDIEQTTGQHETAHARVPKSVRSGLALRLLQSKDDTRLGLVVGFIEDELETIGKQVLYLAQGNVKEERIGAIIEGGKYETFKFRGADIKEGTDVYVIRGSAFPTTLDSKREYLLSLWKEKIMTDPDEMKRLLELSGVLGVHPPTDAKDRKIASQENEMMMNGEPAEPQVFDNHATHLLTHSEFCKDVQLDKSPEEAAPIIQRIVAHMMRTLNQFMRPPEGPPGTSPAIAAEAGAATGQPGEVVPGNVPGGPPKGAPPGGIPPGGGNPNA